MTEPDENYTLDNEADAIALPTFEPIKPISRNDLIAQSFIDVAPDCKEFAILKKALPKDDLEDFNFATEAEDKRAAALDFSFRFKKRISTNRNRYARDSYEVLIGRPSDDIAKTPVAVEIAAPSAAIVTTARAKLRVMKRETPRPIPTPAPAPSSSSSSDDDLGFGRMAFLSTCASEVAPAAETADVMSLVTWEHAINWQGSSSSEDDADTADSEDDADAAGSDDDADTAGNEGDADTAVPKTNQKSLASDAHLVSLEHSQLLVANSSSSLTSSDAMLQLACSPPPARKPEPLTLRNHTLLSCQWLDNVQWTRQRRAKGSGGRSSALGQMTISRHVRLPDEASLKKLLCVSVDEFYSVNLHPLKNQRSRLGVEHSAYAKSFKGLSMNISRYTALISHQVHPPFLCWNSGDSQDAGAAMYFEVLNDREGFKLLPPKLPSEEEDSTQALKELSEAHHFTCIKGPIAIIEHFQEPIFLSSIGMGMRMVAYKKAEVPVADDDPTNYTWQSSEDMRSASFFTDLPDEMQSIKTIQNNMCTAPVVFHRKPSKHRAFLLVCRDGRLFLREVRGIHLAGQQLPLEKVDTIRQPEGYRFQMNRMLLRMNEECPPHEWSRKPLPVDEVLNLCGQERPENNQPFLTFMKTHFQREVQEKDFGEKDKTSTEWMWGKAGVDTSKVLQLMNATHNNCETACLLRSAYVGEAMLRFCHVDDSMRHLDGLHKTMEAVKLHASGRDKDLCERVYEALKRAPWTMTRSYLEKKESGFLVFNGLGLYINIDRQKFVNPIGGKNMSTHLNEERKLFLIKMMEAYTHDHDSDGRKPEELRHYLLRRNNVLLQTREETTIVGGGELPAESRRSVTNAHFKKLMEDIHATYLGLPNPYDLHRKHAPPPSRSRGGKAKNQSISTASRKRKQDGWNSDDSSSSESSVPFDDDWFSEGDDEIPEDDDKWVEDSPPPLPASKIVIKRPFASPGSSATAAPQSKAEAAPSSSSAGFAAPVIRSFSFGKGDSALQDGLQAVLHMITVSKDLDMETYRAFLDPVSLQEFKDYLKVVRQPKCIKDIIAGIRGNKYESIDAFISEVMLISSNCEAFSRSSFYKYDDDLVLTGWALFVKIAACFFKRCPSAIDGLDGKKWSVQQRALFKMYTLDFDQYLLPFIFRVDRSLTAYYKLVKKPICLSEVQMHAASAASSTTSVSEKVKLLCSNCRLFCSSPQGSEYEYYLPKVDKILGVWGSVGCAASTPAAPATPAATATPGVFRIKSGGSSCAADRAPSQASDSVISSDALPSTATYSSTPRIVSHPPGSVGDYVERLAAEFPDFVPDLKEVMTPATYKAYKKLVEQPMSISQMRHKLQRGPYSSEQFVADVQLIGSNCITFWTGQDHTLVLAAHALMKKGAFYQQQEEAQRLEAAAAAMPSSTESAAEPPKKKIFLSLKRSGSSGSDV